MIKWGDFNMTIRFLTPADMAQPASRYHHGVVVPARSCVHVSGQVGLSADGVLADGFEAQCRQAFANIETILAEAGGGLGNIVKLTGILRDREDAGAYRSVRDSVMPRATASTVWIAGLIDPDWLVEIEAIAVLD